MKLIQVTLITPNGTKEGSYISEPDEIDIDALFDGAEPGTRYELKYVEMTYKEYSKLPEFTGF